MTAQSMAGRANQKLRTRTAIVQAAAELSRTGREVTMPEIAGPFVRQRPPCRASKMTPLDG